MYRLVIDSNQIDNLEITLLSEQNHYLRRVLRLKIDDKFIAMDGKGHNWLVKLTSMGAEIIETIRNNTELPVNLTLMVALPKGNGFDDIVRCGTELGVSQFLPVVSHRSLLKPSDQKVTRWRKIALESAEQSERNIVPLVFDPISFTESVLEITKLQANFYFALERQNNPSLAKFLLDSSSSLNNIVIATGCEGGWADFEVDLAIANKFQLVSLGKRILRGVTAPIMAASLVVGVFDNYQNSDS